jgi:membrane protease YdiL (CAAX protease family)
MGSDRSSERPAMNESQRWFWLTLAFEGLLLLLAELIGSVTDLELFADFRWDLDDALWGMSCAALPLMAFVISLRSSRKPFVSIRRALDQTVGRIFHEFSILQLLVISIVAGVSEEVLFRAVLQSGITRLLDPYSALVISGIAFGAAHLLTWSYGLVACLAGIYIGIIWLVTGNLLTPIVLHAVYDFFALVYFLRVPDRRRDEG